MWVFRIPKPFQNGRTPALAALLLCCAQTFFAQASWAESPVGATLIGEAYIPTIWIDPDGCEHWVMDDGLEGYMTPHVNRQGIPVCRRGKTCSVMDADPLFRAGSARISPAGRARLAAFFQTEGALSYIIIGHTDDSGSDGQNIRLSVKRANRVAAIAKANGAQIADVRGYGARFPSASNATQAGMARNRRVEIICIR
jgi:outer membrane protein OmpA-like peptidoglycan-associated protein